MLYAENSGLRAQIVVHQGSFVLDVEIAIDSGTVTAIIGPNGAGKSTLIGAIAGLVALREGRIELDGRTLSDTRTSTQIPLGKRDVAVAFQDELLFDGLSVIDNVAFGLRANGVSRLVARAAVEQLLERTGLADRAHSRLGTLSGGMLARVSLARALAVEPRLLLLDEPFAALDAIAAADYRLWLAALLHDSPTTTLMVTHDPRDVDALADHVYVFELGRVSDECRAAQLKSSTSPFVQRFIAP